MNLLFILYTLRSVPITLAAMTIPTVLDDLSHVGIDLNLNCFVNSYAGYPVDNTDIANTEKRLEDHTTTAIEHVRQLDILDTRDSNTITTALQTSVEIQRYLKDVVYKKPSSEKAKYVHATCENMQHFQQKASGLGESLQAKVQPDHAQRIKDSFRETDQQFDKANMEFQ